MGKGYSKAILASYATFKELYNSKKYKSPYQILSEFVRYIVISKSLYSFSVSDIKGYLKNEFGFDLPIAVIRTSIRNIDGITQLNGAFKISNKNLLTNDDFCIAKNKSEEHRTTILEHLAAFAESKDVTLDQAELEQELLAFVLDREGSTEYRTIISEFILKNSDNQFIAEAISTIQDGGILYTGLTYNISEFGSLRTPISLFLDTEILFHITGLNGDLYQNLAEDFFRLIDIANHEKQIIKLYYFEDVRKDIDKFFTIAERVVDGKEVIDLNHAMKMVVDGCEDISDVADKKTTFFELLADKYHIHEDEKQYYYGENDKDYNLEGVKLPEFPMAEESNFEGLKFCSHINVLRKGFKTKNVLESKYLCITETHKVLSISHALVEMQCADSGGEHFAEYAVSLSYITNLLWYKLNRGFGTTEFPKNLDAVVKARIILSKYIAQGIATKYKEINEKFDNNELSREDAAKRIIVLRNKATLPEELNEDNVEEELNFTEEYLNRFSEMEAHNKNVIKEKDEMIESLSGNISRLENELAREKEGRDKLQDKLDVLTGEINEFKLHENEKKYKKRIMFNRLRLICAIILKIGLTVFVCYLIWYICGKYNQDFGTWLSVALGLLTIFGFSGLFYLRDISKYKERCNQAKEEFQHQS